MRGLAGSALAASGGPMVAAGGTWRHLAPRGGLLWPWWPLAAPGGPLRPLAAYGGPWRLLVPPGGPWLTIAAASFTQVIKNQAIFFWSTMFYTVFWLLCLLLRLRLRLPL